MTDAKVALRHTHNTIADIALIKRAGIAYI